jgi:hypothetical protein
MASLNLSITSLDTPPKSVQTIEIDHNHNSNHNDNDTEHPTGQTDGTMAIRSGNNSDRDSGGGNLDLNLDLDLGDDYDYDRRGVVLFGKTLTELLGMGFKAASLLLLVVYLLAAFIIDFKRAEFLFIALCLVIACYAIVFYASKNQVFFEKLQDSTHAVLKKAETERVTGLIFLGVILAIMIIILAVTVDSSRNLVSLLGLLVCVLVTWLFSYAPRQVNWRPVVGSIFLQFLFGYFVIRTSWGLSAIQFLADQLTFLLAYTYAGSGFVFNWLTDSSLFGTPFQLANDAGTFTLGPPFFFNVLPQVIFFSALVSILYYLRVLPFLVRVIGKVFDILLCIIFPTVVLTTLFFFLRRDLKHRQVTFFPLSWAPVHLSRSLLLEIYLSARQKPLSL